MLRALGKTWCWHRRWHQRWSMFRWWHQMVARLVAQGWAVAKELLSLLVVTAQCLLLGWLAAKWPAILVFACWTRAPPCLTF